MKKVFIIHGFEGSPNGGWRPWLMGELEKQDIYACALSMPTPDIPLCNEWVEEVARHVERNKNDEVYLVGHSLGVPTIMRYLESSRALPISGAILVSGPCESLGNEKLENFLNKPFAYEAIKLKAKKVLVIHGDNDTSVPLRDAQTISKELNGELIVIKNGGHLNGSSGWRTLPDCLSGLLKMMK